MNLSAGVAERIKGSIPLVHVCIALVSGEFVVVLKLLNSY